MSVPEVKVTIKFPTEEELERNVTAAERGSFVPSSQQASGSQFSQHATQQTPGRLTPHASTEESENAIQVLRGVVTEVALFSETLRYRWSAMRQVYHVLIDEALTRYIRQDDDETRLIVGQGNSGRLSLADTEDDTAEIVCHPHTVESARTEIHELLDAFEDGAPFTVQRLSELVLEPEKQYTTLDKFLNALTMVLSVSSLHKGLERKVVRTELALGPVNE